MGVKFSTNGTRLSAERARQLTAMDYLDVQISIDGATAATNDVVRGEGSFAAAARRWTTWPRPASASSRSAWS